MVRTLGPQTDARPVVEPEPALLRLLLRDFQLLPLPLAIVLGPMADHGSPLDALHVHRASCFRTERGDPSAAVAPLLGGERDHVRGQRLLVSPPARQLPLRGAMLADHARCKPFRHALRS